MASKESTDMDFGGGGLSRQNSGTAGSWEFDAALMTREFKFVEKLEDQYVCPTCGQVVLNPHQTGCGHIFCYQCIQGFLDSDITPKCPIDDSFIKANEVFQDNCCKREIANLEIYCTNAPNCSSKVTLCRLQDHLKICQYESVQCPNSGCSETLFRKDVGDHLDSQCRYRLEPCPYCRKHYAVIHLMDHRNSTCLEVKVPCPNNCDQMIKRHELKEHYLECPEVETDCMYKKYGCSFRQKRVKVQAHEDAALNDHLVLVLESNTKLEKQIDDLQHSLVLKHHEFQERTSLAGSLENQVKPLVQEMTRCDNMIGTVQRSLEEQKDRVDSVQLQLQQLTRAFSQDLGCTELAQLRGSLDSLKQQVSAIEGLKERLVMLEDNYMRHSRLLNIHVDQFQRNEERFRELESTSYNGKLIWKIRDYQKKKEAAAAGEGRSPFMLSAPFYTSRSGYKLRARAYLNGDGSGRGTHLSLYIVLMRGDFDSLLPWPFQQPVSLTVLDQSGARKDVTIVFKPDLASSSFHRPVSDMNVATGFPCFISHAELESANDAAFVKDDTLFIKVKVDTTGLEDL
ncbi:TNF receptor-associated factor 5 isoform X1 [Scleropages formosus]|uniref:TNF receptor-associated factor n=1 Tax=Scleropages formosus TaxID=113540 RepID=A0A8C9V9F0_SCLFO|nr:TNF receptor-associated factor 5 isoform X1 [Scleropages formosus]